MTGPGFRRSVAVVVVLAVGLLGGVGWFRARSDASRLPERGRRLEAVLGLLEPAMVLVDRWGTPHADCGSVRDAWFVEGYLHARERFFSMEMGRRLAAGRLAEVLGEDLLARDRKTRTWRLAATAAKQAAQLSPEEREAMEAYALGVNAALERWGRWLSPELAALGVEPKPWRIEDTLGIGLLFQLGVSPAMGEELERAVELEALGRSRAVNLWGWTEAEARRWIPPDAGERPRTPDDAITRGFSGLGSNNWAIAGRRTASGKPLLANDPHLMVSMPSSWYPVHLRAPGLDVAGVSLPGAPGVMIGHTDTVAWGFTMSMLDDQDLYHVSLDATGRRELWRGRWVPLQVVEETIPVLGWKEPAHLEVLVSRHGPVVRRRGNLGLALTWSALTHPSPVGVFLRMNRAGSVEEVEAAWREAAGPGMNLVAADSSGQILHRVVGRVPERGRGSGRLPAPGDDPRWEWRGLRPFEANPRTLNPDRGFVATANHDLFAEGDAPEAERFPAEFDAPWRIRRIRERLAAGTDWTVAGCLRLQMDVESLRARTLLFLFRPDLKRHGGWAARRLLAWDGRMTADDTAPYLFARLVLGLCREAGGDEAARAGVKGTFLGPDELVRLAAGAVDESWWDDVETPEKEGRSQIVDRVLDSLDADRPGRTWGEAHTVTFQHPLGSAPLIGPMLNLLLSPAPVPLGGDGSTVNRAAYSLDYPWGVTVIPSMRFVAAVGEWDHSVLVVPPGASGRPWSSHYMDQLPAWSRGEGVPLPFTQAAVERATMARIELTPAADR